jgi:hypothetical protein
MTALGFKNLVGIVFLGVPDSIDLAYVLCPYPARFQKPSRYVAEVEPQFQWGWARFANDCSRFPKACRDCFKMKNDLYLV